MHGAGGITSKDGTSQKHVVGTRYCIVYTSPYILGGKPGTTKKKQVAT